MISLYAFVSLALVSLTAAQSDNPALGIEAIEAHFKQAGITPDLLPSFNPVAVLGLTYNGVGAISPGKALTKDQVAPAPNLTVTAANSSLVFTDTYTIAMVDAGPVGTDESKGVTRHWLVNGVKITDNKAVGTDGTAITQYAGPAPPAGSGPHRYVILVYLQLPNFAAPAEFSKPNMGVSVFNLGDYVKNSNLGPIIAGTYITVEEGTASVSLSATSAVITSTLAPVTSAGGSASGTSTSTQAKPSNGALDSKGGLLSLIMLLAPFLALTLA
jgi:phosphatidylethanolamine-binding protein